MPLYWVPNESEAPPKSLWTPLVMKHNSLISARSYRMPISRPSTSHTTLSAHRPKTARKDLLRDVLYVQCHVSITDIYYVIGHEYVHPRVVLVVMFSI